MLTHLSEEARLFEKRSNAVIGTGSIVLADCLGHVETGENRCLSGCALWNPRDAQTGIGGDEVGVSIAISAGRRSGWMTIEECTKGWQVGSDQRIGLRFIAAEPNAIEE